MGILIGITLNLGNMKILMMLIIPINYSNIFHLLISSSVSFFNALQSLNIGLFPLWLHLFLGILFFLL